MTGRPASRRTLARVAVAATALLTVVLPVAAATAADPTPPQALFRTTLLQDPGTTEAVKRLLRSGGGFVDARMQFADFTGDGRADAVAIVRTPGASGAVALYVFSTEGPRAGQSGELRAVYRSQNLYRAFVLVRSPTLVVRTPIFAAGQDLCCATKLLERDYRWDARRRAFVRTDLREIELS